MGGGQSVRATHFARPAEEEADAEPDEDQHICISTKMVERLVEDASMTSDTEAVPQVVTRTKPSKQDYKEILFIEKLKALDDTHSEKTGLTVEEIRALHKRIDMRTSNLSSVNEVCPGPAKKVIACYEEQAKGNDVLKCWDTVFDFSKCVHEASADRLNSRNIALARDKARRSRNVQQAREHALKDIKPKRQSGAMPS